MSLSASSVRMRQSRSLRLRKASLVARRLCHAGDGFAFLFVFGDFLYDDVGGVPAFAQVVVHLFFDGRPRTCLRDSAVGYGGQRPNLIFSSGFEERFDVDGDGCHGPAAMSHRAPVREIFDGLGNVF